MELIESNLAEALGLALLVVTTLAWRLTRDPRLKDDLGGVVRLGVAFAVFAGLEVVLAERVPPLWLPYLRAGWMLTLAFALIRTVVSLAMLVQRWLTRASTPRNIRDFIDFALYFLAAIPILQSQLKVDVTTLLGTSAVLSLVLGFALQDTLSNLFAGLSLQLERPFQAGDFVQVGQHVGRVQEVGWRSMRVETLRRELITVPNNTTAKETLVNYSRGGGQPVGVDLFFAASYQAPPNQVKAEALDAIRDIPFVVAEPASWVRVWDWEENHVRYLARIFIADYAQVPALHDELYGRLWYRFHRLGIEIPLPQRVVTSRAPPSPPAPLSDAELAELQLLAVFTPEERRELVQAARARPYGTGEAIVEEGEEGHTFYLVQRGSLSVRRDGLEVGRIERGQGFGEMSLLTGAPRVATVLAAEDCVLLEFDRAAFSRYFTAKPELMAQLAQALAQRQSTLERLRRTATPMEPKTLLERVKRIFGG